VLATLAAAGDEAAGAVAVGGLALGLGLLAALGGEDVHARDDVRGGELLGGAELLAVGGDGLEEGVGREVGGERVGQAEPGGELRAEQRGAQEVERHLALGDGNGLDARDARLALEVGLEFEH
ncbi:hypothetical protein ADL26_16660, partial [Thermoactinomyces vulgaris]